MKRHDLFLLPFAYGFATLGFQILFIRRIISFFGPSEIGYALVITIWLMLTGIGAYTCEKYKVCKGAGFLGLSLYGLLAVTIYGALPRVYGIWNLAPGETGGFLILAGTTLIALFLLCLFSGGLFVGIVKAVTEVKRGKSVAYVYTVESLGALIAGLLITFICFTLVEDRYIALALFVLLVVLMFVKIEKNLLFAPPRITMGIMCFFAALAFVLGFFGHQYGQQEILARTDTPYQHLTLTRYESQKTLYSDGRKLFSTPDQSSAEQIHIIMWHNSDIKKMSVIGMPSPDIIAELAKYKNIQFDIYEYDPVLLKFMYNNLGLKLADNMTVIKGDPFNQLPDSHKQYDLIWLTNAQPFDGIGNRYLTIDFFDRVKSNLTSTGLFSFYIPGTGNRLKSDLREYLSVIYNSLRVHYRNVKILTEDNFFFLAGNDSAPVSVALNALLASRRIYNIETNFVDSTYLAYLLEPLNQSKLNMVYYNQAKTANSISKPAVFYYNSILWAERYSQVEKTILKFWKSNRTLLFIILLLPILTLLTLVRRRKRVASLSLSFLAGLGGMTLEIALLVLYQSCVGNIYSQIGILIGLFMIGVALGGYLPLRLKTGRMYNTKWFYLASSLAGILVVGFLFVTRFDDPIFLKTIIIFLMALLSGVYNGFLFNFASVCYRRLSNSNRPGLLYLLDLSGSTLAGLFVSILFIPLLGFGAISVMILVIMLSYVILHKFVIS